MKPSECIIECLTCYAHVQSSIENAGLTFACPYCGNDVVIPDATHDKQINTSLDASSSPGSLVEVPVELVAIEIPELPTTSVFVSHSTSDHQIVEEEIVKPLRDAGIETWYSGEDIDLADLWQSRIVEGLKKCDWFILVMSSNSAISEFVKDELHWAIEERQGRIIPVMISDCDPLKFHMRMKRIQCVDFRDDIPASRERLIRRLRGELAD